MKKAIGIIVSLALAATTGITTHAATSLNDAEQELYHQLKGFTYESEERIYTVSEDLLNQIEAYMMKDTVDLTEEQCHKVSEYAKTGLNYLASQGIENAEKLSEEQITYLMEHSLTKIGDVLNLEVTYDKENNKLNIKEKESNPPVEPGGDEKPEPTPETPNDQKPSGNVVKDTAEQSSSSYELFGTLFLMSALGALAYYKRNKENLSN